MPARQLLRKIGQPVAAAAASASCTRGAAPPGGLRRPDCARQRARGVPVTLNGPGKSGNSEGSLRSDGDSEEEETLDLFSCHLCRSLLHEPSTAE